MDNRKLPLYIDLVFCIVLLPVMTMLLPIERWLTNHPAFVIILVLWLYAVYFINRKIMVPILFKDRSYYLAVAILVVMVLVTFLISKYEMGPHKAAIFKFSGHREPGRMLFKMRMHEQGVWFLFFVVSVFSLAVGLLTQLNRQMMEKKELEQEKDKAELALYKAQINPHFMFNTLNTLYGLMITGSDKAEAAFMQFTGMMKYMYTNGTRDFIPLSEEAEYIRQYIELQKNRLNEHTKVNFTYSDDGDRNHPIAPMLLITFVENAFKYGVSSHVDSTIDIRLSAFGDRIDFTVCNTVMPDSGAKKGDGIGIANCRKRLQLLYPDAHSLSISRSGDEYKVELTITARKS